MTTKIRTALACAVALPSLVSTAAFAQHAGMDMGSMPPVPSSPVPTPTAPATPAPSTGPATQHSGMDHAAMSHGPGGPGMTCPPAPQWPLSTAGSGTSRLPGHEGTGTGTGSDCAREPSAHPPGGLHVMAGDWMVMAHGFVSAQYSRDTGPRGDDKAYATSMAMIMAERPTAFGSVELRTMFSAEPLMSNRGYPNLFATGESYGGGIPIVDRQHPHDLFMELAGRLNVDLAPETSLFLYGGPVGEPALGPSAFMMRGSARLNPEAPISHHWFDSTHITYGVITAGVAMSHLQLEGSAFRGREPDEDRWDIETPRLDSWSVRATYTPTPALAVQASYGQIHEPEVLHPGENEHRFTASANYATINGFSAMLAFSAKNRTPGPTLTAWLAEANWDLDRKNTLFGRFENVANDELFPDHDDPLHDRVFRVSKFQAGYARRIALEPFELALGAALSTYAKPPELTEAYGERPWSATFFARFSIGR